MLTQPETNPYQAPHFSAAGFAQPHASTGAVNWLLFPLAAAGCVAVSLALAWLLAKLFLAGHYYIAIVPLAAGGALAIAIYYAIRLSQCRNRWLGLALGLGCGCLLYLGYYQFDLAQQAGPHLLARVDALPHYIAFRIQNDVHFDGRRPDNGAPGKPFWPLNLFTFLIEFGVVVWAASVVGLRTASRAFDEGAGRWADVSYATIAHGQSKLILSARDEGRLAPVLQSLTPVPLQQNVSHCLLVLERFAPSGDQPPRTFLSALEIRMPGQVAAVNELLYIKPLALRQLELSADEAAAISALFNQP